MVPFILGLLIGVAFGFIVCAVLNASRQEEEIPERAQREETTDNG